MSSVVETSLAVTVGSVPRRGRPRQQYKCRHCARTFKRSEHCIRHERIHTNEKPFVCRYCPKSYSRKDQVTRHERTLHADGQEQQQDQQQDSIEEYVADQVNEAWAPSALPTATALETQPSDLEEPGTDQNLSGRGAPANESAIRSFPSPRDEADFYPSSSPATSSSNRTTHTTARQRNTPSTTVNTSTNTQPQFATTHDDYDPSCDSPNFATIYPIAQDHIAKAIDPELLPTAMALDDEIPLTQVGRGAVSPHRRQDQNRPGPSGPPDQDPVPFVFSPMPDVDLDLGAFSFSTLPGHIMDLGHNQHNPQMAGDFGPQPLPAGDFEAMSNFGYPPAQVIPDFNPPENPTARPGTLEPCDARDIPLLLQDEPRPGPVLTLDDTAYLSIRSDLAQRLALPDHEIDIPSAKVCQGFLSSYVNNFHGHLPVIHLPTLCPKLMPSPVILAMCSIGALYRLDRRRARQLYDTASRSVETITCPPQNDNTAFVKEYYLWFVQARMLLSFYAIMSGEKDLVLRTMQENGFYTLVFEKARVALGGDKISLSRTTWHGWVEHESWKRLLGALLVESTLSMVMFDVNPGFNATQDLEFEAFHDEALWNAESANEWRELRSHGLKRQQSLGRRTLKQVFIDVMLQGKYHSDAAPYQVSAFSALVLMHAVVVHMWQRLQISQAFAEPGCESSFSSSGHDQLSRSLLDNAMKSLTRCEAFLRGAESDTGQVDTGEVRESSLVFSCHAVLRIAYIRLFKPASPSNRINLIRVDPIEMEASITSFVTAEMERGEQLLDAVVKAFEGFRIPVKLGHLLVRKTAAFRWSVEHAVAGWESALLVTRWVHSVEIAILNGVQLSPRERETLALIREVLREAEYDLDESISLAAGLATTWGWLLQDVWIWGITPRMGSALGVLAKTYERDKQANRRRSLGGES